MEREVRGEGSSRTVRRGATWYRMEEAREGPGMPVALSEGAQDMLVNAELRVGGPVGVGSEEAERELRAAALVGRAGGLTRAGVRVARELQCAWYGE